MIAFRLRWAVPIVVLLILIPMIYFFVFAGSYNDANPERVVTADQVAQRLLIGENRDRGRVMQALYQVEALAAQYGWTPELQRTAGELWLQAGDLARAAEYWQAALMGDVNNVALIRELARTYVILQRWSELETLLPRLLESDSQDTWAHYQIGLLQATFDPAVAEVHLELAANAATYRFVAGQVLDVLRAERGDPLLSMQVGLVLAEQQEWAYAELAFRHAATVAQPFPEALAYVGLARDKQGKDGGDWIEQAVTIGAASPQVRYLQGLHLRYEGRDAESLDAFRAAVALEPDNPALVAELGAAYQFVDDLPEAESWLKLAVALSGNAPEFANLLTVFYEQTGFNLQEDGQTITEGIGTP